MTRWSRAGLLVEQQVIIFGFTVICPLVDSHVYEAARECRVVAEVAAYREEAKYADLEFILVLLRIPNPQPNPRILPSPSESESANLLRP